MLAIRDSDGVGLMEVRNAAGAAATNPIRIPNSWTPLGMTVFPDISGNGVPDLGMLARRVSDGRPGMIRRNAAGDYQPATLLFEP